MTNNDGGRIIRFFERLGQLLVVIATVFSCYITYLAFTRPGIVQVLLPNASPPVDSAVEGTLRATAETLQQANAGLQATATALQQENSRLQATAAALQGENATLALAAQEEPTPTPSPLTPATSPAPSQRSTASSTEPPNDIPGAPLTFNTPVTSVLDAQSKPRDVYAVELTRGQILQVVTESTEEVYVDLAKPGIETVRDRTVLTPVCPSASECNDTFLAAVDGTYHLKVQTGYTGVRYTLTVSVE